MRFRMKKGSGGDTPPWARKLIDQCQAARTPTLDLSCYGAIFGDRDKLTAVPRDVFDMHWLTQLSIAGNGISALPADLERLDRLEALDVSDNPGLVLPPEIGGLPNLRVLCAEEVGPSPLPPEIAHCRGLVELNLGGNMVRTLPSWLEGLGELRVLVLWGNGLKDIPEGLLDAMPRLEVLDLQDNRLTSLPDALVSLRNLRDLVLHKNEIVALPDGTDKLTSLEFVDLSFNRFVGLPASVGAWKELQILNLNNDPRVGVTHYPSNVRPRASRRAIIYRNKGTNIAAPLATLETLPSELTLLPSNHSRPEPVILRRVGA